ncbi:hypothetical protein FACS189421_05900 [Bacteroidia bacterium]|nr:hypothetical protein FACS189421_05900 [Bacteroidia bacterium]GHT02645.1 hypothetical protein FACS189423_01770 [Bacteroidia bacterium]GHT45808.1 hypothetical protein FACS189440_02540 [Bacteroidia bacterium]GHT88613.1 hypothetical protein FACS189474_4170 [Bacteroidia bacterium]
MKKQNINELEFIIDKLTNSIESSLSGENFQTEVKLVTKEDLKSVTKKNKWKFDWKAEFLLPERAVYKLTIAGEPDIIQGLMCVESREGHIFMHLIESAHFNIGRNKAYFGVPGNLVAYACYLSWKKGFEGNMCFIAKTKLIQHYIDTLGAKLISYNTMVINENAARKLIDRYFNK